MCCEIGHKCTCNEEPKFNIMFKCDECSEVIVDPIVEHPQFSILLCDNCSSKN
jgi:hypothetical protein